MPALARSAKAALGTGEYDASRFRTRPKLMKSFIAVAFIGILAALGAALVFLMRDKGATNRTVNALTVRVALSVALLLFIWISWALGWIQPRQY